MSDIIGHVDALGRPMVSLSIQDDDNDVLVVVDTGFNGTLLLYDGPLARQKCEISGLEETVEFADQERRTLLLGRSWIVWFGQRRNVNLFISRPRQPRTPLPDDPVGLIGTALLAPHAITIDFAARRVVISENEG